jgi:hypothetical protein
MFKQVADGRGNFGANLIETVHIVITLLIKSSKFHRIHLGLLIYCNIVIAIVDFDLLLYQATLPGQRSLKNLSKGQL